MSKIRKAMEKAEAERAKEWSDSQESENGEQGDLFALVPVVPRAIARSFDKVTLKPRHLENNRILNYLKYPKVKDYYNLLRTRVYQKTLHQGHNTIMFAGSISGEGSTLTAINLAISIASDMNHFAVLVDTQFRQPKMHKYLGLGEGKGLSDYLLYGNPLHELLIRPGMEKLRVLLAGEQKIHSTELLDSPRMKHLIWEMKSFSPKRYIIFNSPPLLESPDALVLSSYMDAIILVVQEGKTRQEQILKACEILQGRNVIGIVFNNIKRA